MIEPELTAKLTIDSDSNTQIVVTFTFDTSIESDDKSNDEFNETNCSESALRLGDHYAKIDTVLAMKYYMKSSQLRKHAEDAAFDQLIQLRMADLLLELQGGDIYETMWRRIYEKAARDGNEHAMMKLGVQQHN